MQLQPKHKLTVLSPKALDWRTWSWICCFEPFCNVCKHAKMHTHTQALMLCSLYCIAYWHMAENSCS